MNGVMLDGSKAQILDDMIAQNTGNFFFGLFDTLTALSHSDLSSAITAHDASFTGYSRQGALIFAPSTLTAETVPHAESEASVVTFTNSGGSPSTTITGWYIYDNFHSKVVWAGLYDTPFVIGAGRTYSTVPILRDSGDVSAEP